MPDHELPASVRVALWGTLALGDRIEVGDIVAQALPDLDDSAGLEERLSLWQSLGERALLVALPRPGDLTGMPRAGTDALSAATAATECVFVPGIGGVLVPLMEQFGPVGDRGWRVRWQAFDAEPYPTHRVEALDLGQIELRLRTDLARHTEALTAAGGSPFGAAAEQGLGRVRAAQASAWGLPPGMPGRAARLISLAGSVLLLTEAGLDPAQESVDLTTTTARARALRELQGQACTALAEATNAAVLHLADWG